MPQAADISTLPSFPAMTAFVERTLPGNSAGMIRLRRQILEFVASPTSRAVLFAVRSAPENRRSLEWSLF